MESGKSIILYLPPKDTAGFATVFVSAPSLLPEQDQAELTQGIQIRTQEALDQILEDFLS